MRDKSIQSGRGENGECLCQVCRDGRYFKQIVANKDIENIIEFANSVYNDYLNESEENDYNGLVLNYIKKHYPQIFQEAHKHKWD